MEIVQEESEQDLHTIQSTHTETTNKLDEFFSSFEENMIKPKLFERPKDGDECDSCSS